MAVTNLEPLCARYGMELVSPTDGKMAGITERTKLTDRENVVTRALGVLVENGIYAMTVYLMTCNKSDYGVCVLRQLARLLADREAALLPDKNWEHQEGLLELLKEMRGITEDLSRLLLARRLLEGALTFARYHCKSLGRDAGEKA